MTLAFFIPVIWIGIVDGNPIGHANASLSLLMGLYFPEVALFFMVSSMFTLAVRHFDLRFNLFGLNSENTDDRPGCPYCEAAINSISTVCSCCQKELPEDIVNSLKANGDIENKKPVVKSKNQVILEYVLGVFFIVLSLVVNAISNPGSQAYVMGSFFGASTGTFVYTTVYVKWGFGKSLPDIKFFPRDNGFLVFSEILLIHELIFLYRAMT